MILSIKKHLEYHIVNLMFLVAVLLLLVYLQTNMHVIQCPYAAQGMACKTCGLTTSFKKIVGGNVHNIPLGNILLAIVFLGQLLIRPLLSGLLLTKLPKKYIVMADVVIHALLLGFAFKLLLL